MKILFISAKDVNAKSNGGELCTNRNYLSFCDLVGKQNVKVLNLMETIPSGISNAIKKRINYLFGFYEGLSNKRIHEIIKLSGDCEMVFIDSSIHGIIAYHLKKKKYPGKIISFFHNVEYKIKLDKAKIQPWKLAEIIVTRKNEQIACAYSSEVIAVNERDKVELENTYKVKDVKVIPISLRDTFDGFAEEKTANPATFLFTGNNWYANIHGINWFIENVLDHVNIKLQITGHKMDALKDKYQHPKIEFLGFVDDLGAVIKKADFILTPIFIGSGMKVKTCEALMYGKNIVGTTEAFEGNKVDYNKVGALCNTKEEFIRSITTLTTENRNKFNKESRKYFDELYSYDATLKDFKRFV